MIQKTHYSGVCPICGSTHIQHHMYFSKCNECGYSEKVPGNKIPIKTYNKTYKRKNK